MLGRRHNMRSHAERLPEFFQERDCVLFRLPSGCENARSAAEEVRSRELDAALFGAGHGMRAEKLNTSRKISAGPADRKDLGTADIGYDTAIGKVIGYLLHERLEGADGGGSAAAPPG